MRLFRILWGVLRSPRYATIALVISVLVFSGATWFSNTALIVAVVTSSAPFFDKIALLGTLYGSIGSNFTIVSATYTILIALLFGMQVALLSYYITKARSHSSELNRVSLTSLGGLLSGVFGIGCAACGSFLLTSMLAVVGAGGLLALLPFGGEEFGVLGVALLLYSMYVVLKKIDTPFVCPI